MVKLIVNCNINSASITRRQLLIHVFILHHVCFYRLEIILVSVNILLVMHSLTSWGVSASGPSFRILNWTCCSCLCQIFRFIFSYRTFYMVVPGFATNCPCDVWYRGLATCLLNVVHFGNQFRCMWTYRPEATAEPVATSGSNESFECVCTLMFNSSSNHSLNWRCTVMKFRHSVYYGCVNNT